MATAPLAVWEIRAALKEAIRAFFNRRGYLELDTPIAVVCPGTETYLRYFRTEWRDHRGDAHELYLRSSPELHLKQAVAAGASRVYQLAPCFRNGGELASWHQPEFTMLEFYETGLAFDSFVDMTEALLRDTHAAVAPLVQAKLGRDAPALPPRFQRVTVTEAFREFAGVSLIDEDPDLGSRAAAAGVHSVSRHDDFETAFFKTLIERVEPAIAALGGAVLLDYPPSQAALATVRDGVAKRCEFYIGRVELSNGFEELLDAAANEARIKATLARRAELGFETPAEDVEFYDALRHGLPPCCGNALGFDRWLAWLIGDTNLDRAVPFRRAGLFRHPLP